MLRRQALKLGLLVDEQPTAYFLANVLKVRTSNEREMTKLAKSLLLLLKVVGFSWMWDREDPYTLDLYKPQKVELDVIPRVLIHEEMLTNYLAKMDSFLQYPQLRLELNAEAMLRHWEKFGYNLTSFGTSNSFADFPKCWNYESLAHCFEDMFQVEYHEGAQQEIQDHF